MSIMLDNKINLNYNCLSEQTSEKKKSIFSTYYILFDNKIYLNQSTILDFRNYWPKLQKLQILSTVAMKNQLLSLLLLLLQLPKKNLLNRSLFHLVTGVVLRKQLKLD